MIVFRKLKKLNKSRIENEYQKKMITINIKSIYYCKNDTITLNELRSRKHLLGKAKSTFILILILIYGCVLGTKCSAMI